jgi:hypothetical protein
MSTSRPLPLHRSRLPCIVPGCREPRVQKSASNYCQMHRYHWKVHGSPLQDAIKIAEIRRWEQDVRRIYKRLPKAQRGDLSGVAARYCATFHDFLRNCAAGRENAQNRFSHETATRLLKVFDSVDPLAILTRVAALFLMREQSPRMFRDERAFRFQLVRGVRKLTSVADGSYWDNTRQRVKQICDEIPARVRETMAEWLVEFSIPFAFHVSNCAALTERTEKTQALLAAEVFAPLREKLHQEHAKAERKLQIARRLAAEQREQP